MDELDKRIQDLLNHSNYDQEYVNRIIRDGDMAPFSVKSRLLTYLLHLKVISYQEYDQIIEDYYHDGSNTYLRLFDMTPKKFGGWIEKHVRSLAPEFVKATKESVHLVYPDFNGEFDILVDRTRVEVKACRAAEDKERNNASTSLSNRAYSHKAAAENKFQYHFEQVKTSCCDIFIFIGVCRDELLYWVLTSNEVRQIGKMSPQHRNENTGKNTGEVFEGQIFMTEEQLAPYRVEEKDLLSAVKAKGVHFYKKVSESLVSL